MAIMKPANDIECLALAHEQARQLAVNPQFRAFVLQFKNLRAFIRHIRSLEQRDDLGDPNDGPRLPCEVSQRLRLLANDPNCFERTVRFLAAAEILEPAIPRTSASLILNQGWHTFPIEVVDGRPYPVVLDPISPPTNMMLATAYRAQNISPVAEKHLVPWFGQMARNACIDDGGEDCFDYAIDSLRNALMTGDSFDGIDDLDYVLDCAAADAVMFGGPGHAAVGELRRSLRNLSFKLDKGLVTGFVNDLAKKAEKMAPQAIKAALVAKFGPAAALALQGVDLALQKEEPGKPSTALKSGNGPELEPAVELPFKKDQGQKVGTLKLTLEPSKPATKTTDTPTPIQHLRRMTLAFRN